MSAKKKRWPARIYVGRGQDGKQQFVWCTPSHYKTRRERDDAVAARRTALRLGGGPRLPLVQDYVDRYLTEYARLHPKSYPTTEERLRRFRKDFEGRTLDIDRQEAKDWVNGHGRWTKGPAPAYVVPGVVTLYNHAINDDDLPLARNPFRGLGVRTRGRADEPPPTEAEFDALLAGCSALKHYAPMMRAFTRFAAFTLMRPGELYELEWADIDFEAMRIRKARRLYRGTVAEPKTGKKLIALTPPARDAIMVLPRDGRLVFSTKTGRRMSQTVLCGYWAQVCAAAGLGDKPFYLCTKHYGVHYMWTKLGMSRRAIAAQAGWSVGTVDKMLAIYGHFEVGALEEVDEAFRATGNVVGLRKVENAG